MTALGYADHWPFGIPWEDVHLGKITESMILSLNNSANIRAKNRRINIVISNTDAQYGEANQSIHFYQDLYKSVYNRIEQNISSRSLKVSYKLIISRFDENYTMTFSFPPIVGPNTGQLIASIPHFIMQAPSESDEVERWGNKIVDWGFSIFPPSQASQNAQIHRNR